MLNIKNLNAKIVNNDTDDFTVLRNISFTLEAPEILGILGESGSGKSMLAKSILGLNTAPIMVSYDELSFSGHHLRTESDFHSVRGDAISMIFQHPTSALNPVFTIGEQIVETILFHNKAQNKYDAIRLAISTLAETGLDYPAERMNSYPHQLSGGMNQRVMIAMALASEPQLMIADEPTTALDVITQAQIVQLLQRLGQKHNFATLFITHDLSLMEKIAQRVVVMYAGEIVESLSATALANGQMRHPCTYSLKRCIPRIGTKEQPLYTIPGQIAHNCEKYDTCCIFYERCPYVQEICRQNKPQMKDGIACFLPINS